MALQVKEAADAGDGIAFSPRTTSLSVVRAQTQQDAAEERFFRKLDEEVRTLCSCPAFCTLLLVETDRMETNTSDAARMKLQAGLYGAL